MVACWTGWTVCCSRFRSLPCICAWAPTAWQREHPLLAPRSIALLGCTGSVGEAVLDVVAAHPGRFRVVAMAASGSNLPRLYEQIRRFRPEAVALWNVEAAERLRERLADEPVEVLAGVTGVEGIAAWDGAEMTVSAIVGAAGLRPTLAAVRAGKDVALANKECLVMAGRFFMEEARRHKVRVIPVDSEHSAIFQVLCQGQGDLEASLRVDASLRLILTASGGPFRGYGPERLAGVTSAQALNHPNWSMGRKITIDSATCMNKGLEVIEAHHLFGVDPDRIEVVIHPESIVHSMVAWPDGSVLAQLGVPDMRTPIAVALAWPERITAPVPALDLVRVGTLRFFGPPDPLAFPCLELAYAALRRGGAAPAILNGANEVAVNAFLEHRIGFMAIPSLIEWTLGQAGEAGEPGSVSDILEVDQWARRRAGEWIARYGKGPEVA
ncbi:MAG: 1-deoxy-D-xylulose-5-phosphate reductoisomerase [Magnetococcales bacterium]|nr:1-deoxy-D-xylulose-5-phosphate reductoisomerase [Magnetococcales bacterium]